MRNRTAERDGKRIARTPLGPARQCRRHRPRGLLSWRGTTRASSGQVLTLDGGVTTANI